MSAQKDHFGQVISGFHKFYVVIAQRYQRCERIHTTYTIMFSSLTTLKRRQLENFLRYLPLSGATT